jgi:hypothetical protein
MKILHAPFNIGGMASTLANAQRALGYNARSLVFSDNKYKYPVDFDLSTRPKKMDNYWFRIRLSLEFKVFQYYYGNSIFGHRLWEIPLLKRMGKKLFFYFVGCDLRNRESTIANYPISACAECKPRQCSASDNKNYRDTALAYGNVNFVSTPDLLEFLPRSVLLPQAVDFDLIDLIDRSSAEPTDCNRLSVAHAPTNRMMKGTGYLLQAVQELKQEGFPIDLMLIENLPHEQALRQYRRADIAVDQLLTGSYGLLSAELMGLGVPTLCYLRPDILRHYPEPPPIINANPANIKEQLIYCFESKDKLRSMSNLGRAYAKKHHHPLMLAKKCLGYYLN